MSTQKSLSLRYRLKLTHPSLPYPGRLMRLLCSIVGIPVTDVDGFRYQLAMRYTITPKLICHDLPGLAAMPSQQTFEEPLSRSAIPAGLEIHIDNFSILVHSSPKVELLAINLDEDFIDVECVAVALVLSLQASGVYSAEFDTPEADGFVADGDATLGKQVFDVPVAEIESKIEPDSVGDDFSRESVALVCIHGPIVSTGAT